MTHHDLILSVRPLVTKIVCEVFGRYNEDAASEAYVGLCRAAEKFEPERGLKFTTYAHWWIRAYVLRWLMVEKGGAFRLGQHSGERDAFFGMSRARRHLEACGVEPTDELIAERVGCEPEDVAAVAAKMRAPVQYLHAEYDRPIEIPDSRDTADEIETDDATRFDAARLRQQLRRLEPRERKILERRYLGEKVVTLAEIGRSLGLSRERVRQLEVKALAKLRAGMRAA